MKRDLHAACIALVVLTASVVLQAAEPAKNPYKYQPVGNGIEMRSGQSRFNLPLYSSVERENRLIALAGDRPEFMLMRISATKSMDKLANIKLGCADGPWFDGMTPVVGLYEKGLLHYKAGEAGQTIEIDVIRAQSFEGLLLRVTLGKSAGPLVMAVGGRGSNNYDQNPKASAFNPAECSGTRLVFSGNVLTVSEKGPALFATASVPLTFVAAHPDAVANGPKALLETPATDSAVGALVAKRPANGIIYLIATTDKPDSDAVAAYLKSPERIFAQVVEENRKLASSIEIDTPDPYLNAAMPAVLLGYNAAWNAPTFRHGAIAWHDSFAAWRVTYGGTCAGWHDRVQSHMNAFFEKQHPDGRIPSMLATDKIYNMNEQLVDQALYDYRWTGDLEPLREGGFDAIAAHLAWGEKYLKTPDGLYENFLNAWNTDYKWSNGGGGAIASTYYWLGNKTMAEIAGKLGRDPSVFRQRADEIAAAMKSRLWSERVGVYGEYRDSQGLKLLHESPDISSIYTPIDLDFSDPFESYRMLRFGLRRFEQVTGLPRGALIYSSEWLPDHYSTRGVYTAEIINLMLALYRNGQVEAAEPFRQAMDGSFLAGPAPGSTGYVISSSGAFRPHTDFTDTTSIYIRNVVEGLFGVQMFAPDQRIVLQPGFPREWERAAIRCSVVEYQYTWNGRSERMQVQMPSPLTPTVRLRARRADIAKVMANGRPVKYAVEPGIGCAWITITAPRGTKADLSVEYGDEELPTLEAPDHAMAGTTCTVRLDRGRIGQVRTSRSVGEPVSISDDATSCTIPLPADAGVPTYFVLVAHHDARLWIPVEVDVGLAKAADSAAGTGIEPALEPRTVDLGAVCNQRLADLHKNEYTPRLERFYWTDKEGLRTVAADGRVWWETRKGIIAHDTSKLEEAAGRFVVDTGIPFAVGTDGKDSVFTSLYDNFPDRIEIPVNLRGRKVCFLVAASITLMQSRMDNGLITVKLGDGTERTLVLRDPETIDDWLGSGTGKSYLETPNIHAQALGQNTHAVLQEIDLGEERMIKSVVLETRTNETMIGLLGITVMQEKPAQP